MGIAYGLHWFVVLKCGAISLAAQRISGLYARRNGKMTAANRRMSRPFQPGMEEEISRARMRELKRQRSPLAHGGRPASEKGTMAWNGFILQWTDVWCAAPSWKRDAGCVLTAKKRVPPCRSRPSRSRSRCRSKRKLAGSEKRNRNNNVVRTKNPYHVLYFSGSFFNRNWAHRPVNRPAAMPHSSSHGR